MKKILFISFFTLLPMVSTRLVGNAVEKDKYFDGSLSAGYVFKNDSKFKDVYGRGIVNVLTADGCYYPWERWGFGAKISYWRKKGCTTFLQLRSILQEVPITFYVRRIKKFDCGLQMNASLGAGVVWMKEKSYLGKVKLNKAIGEVEVGLQYSIVRWFNIVGAFRYLFPPQRQSCKKKVVGGFDLRAGIGFSF